MFSLVPQIFPQARLLCTHIGKGLVNIPCDIGKTFHSPPISWTLMLPRFWGLAGLDCMQSHEPRHDTRQNDF